MFYTIQGQSIIKADKEQALTRFYDNVLPLPSDYEEGKYIIVDGELALNTNWEKEKEAQEQERIAKLSMTKREIFLALYKDTGLTPEQIKSGITNPEALIEFEYANEYYRGNPLIDIIGSSLGYTAADLNYLFENKALPQKEEPNA